MTTKEKVKRELDKMPDDLIEKVYIYMSSIKSKKKVKKRMHTFKLNGTFDHQNIRAAAYE